MTTVNLEIKGNLVTATVNGKGKEELLAIIQKMESDAEWTLTLKKQYSTLITTPPFERILK